MAKFNLTPRRKKILEMRLNGRTLQEIGDEFRISKERVRQILKNIERTKRDLKG